ncbi:MAG TPA: MOSC N-terminal beta barrel domain-containing protein, partial [Polyangia bacterium]|nr:MOSC N-terminal beta barrel domain-containing protein [Polyangia bacterium]
MKLHALYVHPIKSCAAIAVAAARLTARGLEHDRRWMVVDETGRFLTQRVLARMALVRLSLQRDTLEARFCDDAPLVLPFLFSDGPCIDIAVWSHRGPAVRHDAGSAWFTRVLARPAQLVCMPDDIVRPVDFGAAHAGDRVSFADGFPLL